jgi:hypothetical protein
MKTTVKQFLLWLPVRFLILWMLLMPRPLAAQGTLNALTYDSGVAVVGYVAQGVGWSFVPTTDLLVTGLSSSAPQVDFWLGTNQNIATYNYAGPYGNGQPIFLASPATNFQTISPLLLSAGQTYFISTQQTNFASSVNVFAYSRNGNEGILSFNVSPYISQYANYLLSSGGQWSSPTSPASDNVNILLLGPNFQFQVVPEPTNFELLLFGFSIWLFIKRITSNLIHARQTL